MWSAGEISLKSKQSMQWFTFCVCKWIHRCVKTLHANFQTNRWSRGRATGILNREREKLRTGQTDSARPTQTKRNREAEVCLHSAHSLKLTGPRHHPLRHSTSLSCFEPTHVDARRKSRQEMHQNKENIQHQILNVQTGTEEGNQQDVFYCSLSGWVCLALVAASGIHLKSHPRGATVLDDNSLTSVLAKIANSSGHAWCIQWPTFLR